MPEKKIQLGSELILCYVRYAKRSAAVVQWMVLWFGSDHLIVIHLASLAVERLSRGLTATLPRQLEMIRSR